MAGGEGSRPELINAAADGRKAEEEAAGGAVRETVAATAFAGTAAGEKKPPGPEHRMTKREIRSILAYEPAFAASVYKALKLRNPELKPSPEEETDECMCSLYSDARLFYEYGEKYPEMQERVRRELQTKGYVEVDDEWVQSRAEDQALIDETRKRIDELFLEYPPTEDEDEDEDEDDSDSDYSDEDY